MRGASVIAIAAGSLAAASPASAAEAPACAGADQLPAVVTIAQTRAAIACLVDASRTAHGVPALHVDTRLQRAAQRFARALKPSAPLTHRGSGASTPIQRITLAGYPRGAAFTAAETLGRSHGTLAAPAVRVAHWLDDDATRQLLLSARYADIGIGVVTRRDTTTFVVELARRSDGARTPKTPKPKKR